MHPILIHLGSLDVRAYGVFTLLGYALGGSYVWAHREELGLSKGQIVDLWFAVAAGGLLGGKLGGALLYYHGPWVGYRALTHGGFSFFQGFWGAILAAYAYCRFSGKSVGLLGDRVAVAAPLGHAVGRLGCFLNGCCYGKPTELPWGLVFDAGGQVPQRLAGLRLHPNQLYDFLGNIVLAVLLHRALERRAAARPAPPGTFFCVYLAAYGVLRFALEPLRADDAGRLAWALTTAQWIALAHIAVAAYFLVRARAVLNASAGSELRPER